MHPNPTELKKASEYQLLFERGGRVDEETFRRILEEAIEVAESSGYRFLVMGGIASSQMGRPRWTHDIDLFVRPEEARGMLHLLDDAGFVTQETYPDWLFKALKDEVLVDLIFKSAGDIYLDDEMMERAETRELCGIETRVISREDLIVIKALAHNEQSPRHWHDALSLITHNGIDWDYLARRVVHGPRRIASLLMYAQSCDLQVPDEPVREILRAIYRV